MRMGRALPVCLAMSWLMISADSTSVSGQISIRSRTERLLAFEITESALGRANHPKVPVAIRLTAREGWPFRIKESANSYFVARLKTTNVVSLSQLLPPALNSGQAPKAVSVQAIERKKVATYKDDDMNDVLVRYLGSKTKTVPEGSEVVPRSGSAGRGSICCVGCGPIRVCGDSVEIPGCGSCGTSGGFGAI